MRIWMLTEVGRRMARSIRNSDTPANIVLHALDKLGSATSDRIAAFCGIEDIGIVNGALSQLARTQPPCVQVVG